jgi:N-acetylglucosamine kinase-like BadF-type ATPase
MACILGLDGGGTKTTAILADERGRILGVRVGARASGSGTREIQLMEVLSQLVKPLVAGSGGAPIALVYAGISGIDRAAPADVKHRLRSHLVELSGARQVVFDDDGDLGVAARSSLESPEELPRVVVLAGTGTGYWGVGPTGARLSMHGWGSIIGDEGSGYDIGKRMLRVVSRAFDGRGPDTLLKQLLLEAERFASCEETRRAALKPAPELSPEERSRAYEEVHTAIYFSGGMSRHEIAGLAVHVTRAAESGDEVARSILRSVGEELGNGANVLAERLGLKGTEYELLPVGGVFRGGRYILQPLCQTVHGQSPEASVLSVVFAPALGSLVLGLEQLGIGMDEEIKRNMMTGKREWPGLEEERRSG